MDQAGRSFIGALLHRAGRLVPAAMKHWMLRELNPGIVDGTARLVQGIEPVHGADARFMDLYGRVAERCLIDRKKAFVLYSISRGVTVGGGAVAELGVYRGATAKIILETCDPAIQFYGLDTFAGLPPTDAEKDPYWTAGELKADDVETVAAFLDADNATLIKGIFPASAAGLPADARYQLVHVDCDIYQATKDACAYFYPRLEAGGILLIDDYGLLTCPGVRNAADEYFADQDAKPIYISSAQAIVVKR